MQTVHVINQSMLIAGKPAITSRLIGAYMCFMRQAARWALLLPPNSMRTGDGMRVQRRALVSACAYSLVWNTSIMKLSHLLLAIGITAIWGINFR